MTKVLSAPASGNSQKLVYSPTIGIIYQRDQATLKITSAIRFKSPREAISFVHDMFASGLITKPEITEFGNIVAQPIGDEIPYHEVRKTLSPLLRHADCDVVSRVADSVYELDKIMGL